MKKQTLEEYEKDFWAREHNHNAKCFALFSISALASSGISIWFGLEASFSVLLPLTFYFAIFFSILWVAFSFIDKQIPKPKEAE